MDSKGTEGFGDGSFEGRNREERLLLPRAIPVVAKFLEVKLPPLVDEFIGCSWSVAFVNCPGLDLDHRLVPSIKCMEVGGRMIAIIKANDDAVKPAHLRQEMVPLWLGE